MKIKIILKTIIIRNKFLMKIAMYFRKKLSFFYLFHKLNIATTSSDHYDGIYFEVVKDYSSFLKKCNKFNVPYDEIISLKRFEYGSIFYFMHNNSNYLTYGWSIEGTSNFLIQYINLKVKIMDNNILLFDFMTNPLYRKKGYYKIILSKIINLYELKSLFIYTAPSNVGSTRGILANDFTKIGEYSKFNNRKLFRNLKRKNILIKKTNSKYFFY